MNESENLLIIALSQLGVLPNEISNIMQITNDDFSKILLKLCKKIISIKGLETVLPDTISKDLNVKYKDSQKIVDFLKQIGFKQDININNILFPSIRDMARILEFAVEFVTNIDNIGGMIDYGQNFNEKNLAKIKLVKQLNSWTRETWLHSEFIECNIEKRQYMLKEGKKLKLNFEIPEKIKYISEKKNDELSTKIINEDDYKINNNKYSNNNNIVIKIRKSFENDFSDKTINQQFLDLINRRENAVSFIKNKFSENNFINNIKIIQSFNSRYLKPILNQDKTVNTEEKSQSIIQNKIETLINNFENEKCDKNREIQELNCKLNIIMESIQNKSSNVEELEIRIKSLKNEIEILSNDNENILKEIESKLETFEQIQELNTGNIREDDIINEVQNLEKKYDEMITNWDEYSSQAKSRIEELKNTIDTKKKEYNFKYEKITLLKKEVEDISTRMVLKQELTNFLNDEYQKTPLDINRNKFITKIAELTQSIILEKHNILNYINECKEADSNILSINESIKRFDNEIEDKLFTDAKNNSSLKELYSLFIKIREGYNIIQKNIIDNQIAKNKLKEIENKTEDYQIKLKSYDINQLKDQVELMRLENSK